MRSSSISGTAPIIEHTFTPRLTLQVYGQMLLGSKHYTEFLSFQSDPAGPRPAVRLSDLRLAAAPVTNPDFEEVVVNLSSGEFSLLRAFVERPQRVLTRDQLLEFARGPDSDAFDRAIDVQISRLRRKLDDGGGSHELIRTIRNEGYMFTAKVKRT